MYLYTGEISHQNCDFRGGGGCYQYLNPWYRFFQIKKKLLSVLIKHIDFLILYKKANFNRMVTDDIFLLINSRRNLIQFCYIAETFKHLLKSIIMYLEQLEVTICCWYDSGLYIIFNNSIWTRPSSIFYSLYLNYSLQT